MNKRRYNEFNIDKEWERITDLTNRFSKVPKDKKAIAVGEKLLLAQVLLEKIQTENNNKESNKELYLYFYNGSLVKTQDFNKLCLLLSCLNIRNTSINFRWSFVS